MAHQAKIKLIQKGRQVHDGVEFLEVSLEIRYKKKVKEIKKFSFPLDTSTKTIKAEMVKYMESYERDLVLADQTKESEELNNKADKTIESLTGEQIK
jgi:hypothetical protein